MADASLDTAHMHDCVCRWQGGDRAAADELLLACAGRLEHLTRRMLRGYPTVGDQAETADVLQGCMVRLLAALRTVRPAGIRDFYNLAAVQARRELVDLARSFACRLAPQGGHDCDGPAGTLADERATPSEDLELWSEFHLAVEGLPAELREVVGLAVYQGWTHARIAELMAVDERTIRRYWRAAIARLAEA